MKKHRFVSESFHAINAIALALNDPPTHVVLEHNTEPWKGEQKPHKYFVVAMTEYDNRYISGLIAGVTYAFSTSVTLQRGD